ncbi:MAG TPA: hypothetical protein VEL28_11845 [Candidatus Binatia bacterium]|nr:hypothetical protein [Candidatus Binatia bacterium]
MDPSLVIFAIEACVRIGRKTYDVLIDETQNASMLLPVGSLAGSYTQADAIHFFARPENEKLIADGGPYAHLRGKPGLVDAMRTVQSLDAVVGEHSVGASPGAAAIVTIYEFEQYKRGLGPKSPAQRILGTIVEIGIDYFAANPKALAMDSSSRKIVRSLVVGLQDVDLAEDELGNVARNLMLAALGTLEKHPSILSDDARVSALLGGIAAAARDEMSSTATLGELQRRDDLFRRIAGTLIKTGATTVAKDPALFVHGKGKGKEAIRETVAAVLTAVRDADDLFSDEGLDAIVDAALGAAGENFGVFVEHEALRSLLTNTVHALAEGEARDLFGGAAAEKIVLAALQTVVENSETLIDPAKPQQQLIAAAVTALANGLASDLAGPGGVKDLFSSKQLVELSRIAFEQVARHPEQLLGNAGDDPRRMALAQILASVASAAGADPQRLLTGAGFIDLAEAALLVTVKNADKLLHLEKDDPTTNVLYSVLAAVAGALADPGANARLVDRDTFVAIGASILPVVSNNLDRILGTDATVVRDTVAAALQLGTGELANRINAGNFPILVEDLLRDVLLGDLAPNDRAAVAEAAAELLRLAA